MTIAIDEQIAKFIIWTLYFIGLYYSLFWISVLVLNPQPNTKKKRKDWPGVTIILPIWNEERFIEATLDSIYNLDYPKNKLKVICVNDGSTDKSLSILKKLQKKHNFTIINQKNQGKHIAVNNGLKQVDTPFFACFDADSYTQTHSLKVMIEEFDTKQVAAVMPIMKVWKPENILEKVQWLEYTMNVFYKYIMGKLDCIHVVPGPFSTYRTDIVKKLGYFKKAYNTEDLEMALRLQDNHYILKQSLEAVIYTKPPKILKGFIHQRVRWYRGTLLNVRDYKHFLFNKKYGDFGMYHIPLVGITGILAVIGVLTAIYLAIKNSFHTIKRMYLTHFDIWTYITNYRWNTTLLDLDWQVLFSSGVLFLLVFIIIYLSFISSKERINLIKNFKNFLMFLYYFMIYRFLMAYIWIKVIWKIILKKEHEWGKVN